MAHFTFRFDHRYRLAAAPFGVTPKNSSVEVIGGTMTARFGPWRVQTPVANVAGCEETGPFSFLKTAGPAHLSFADRGLTFASNGESGLCIRFVEPVRGIDPLGRIRHPGLTVTVEGISELRTALENA